MSTNATRATRSSVTTVSAVVLVVGLLALRLGRRIGWGVGGLQTLRGSGLSSQWYARWISSSARSCESKPTTLGGTTMKPAGRAARDAVDELVDRGAGGRDDVDPVEGGATGDGPEIGGAQHHEVDVFDVAAGRGEDADDPHRGRGGAAEVVVRTGVHGQFRTDADAVLVGERLVDRDVAVRGRRAAGGEAQRCVLSPTRSRWRSAPTPVWS